MLRKSRKILGIALSSAFLFTTSVHADTVWDGSLSADMNNIANWSAGLPDSADVAIFDDTGAA